MSERHERARRPAMLTYLCFDSSESVGRQLLATVPAAVREICEALARRGLPFNSKLCVVNFAAGADVLVSMTDASLVVPPQPPTPSPGTSYSELFRTLRRLITEDLHQLSVDEILAYRPLVLVVSDGECTDDNWSQELHSLTDFDRVSGRGNDLYPIVVPVSITNHVNAEFQAMAAPRYHRLSFSKWSLDTAADIVVRAVSLALPLDALEEGRARVSLPELASAKEDDWL